MNKKSLIGIALFWFIIVAIFVGYKEYTVQSGTKVLLKTKGYDPNDIFRGEYVKLRYEVNQVSVNLKTSDYENLKDLQKDFGVGDIIYVLLSVDEKTNVAVVKKVVKNKPASGLFLKGEVSSSYHPNLGISYGLDSYFVEEGKGWSLENMLRDPEYNAFTEISIDKFGKAVILDLDFKKKTQEELDEMKRNGWSSWDF